MGGLAELVGPITPASLTAFPLTFSPAVQLLVPVLALASAQPRRPDFVRRAIIAALLFAIGMALVYVPMNLAVRGGTLAARSTNSFLVSVGLLCVTVPVVLALFETGIWNAVFCVSSGYVIQNLASGTQGFASLLAQRLTGSPALPDPAAAIHGIVPYLASAPAYGPIFLASFASVYALAWLLFVRPIRRSGLGDVENHGMVAVFSLVILAVIAFDVTIKALVEQGAPLAELAVLRAVHGAVCVFILFMEYEMLYNKRLELQMEESRRMLAEQARQYEMSRKNIEAINVKCHDIRHQIRHLADGAPGTVQPAVDPAVLADIAREVDVYDSTVKTGNDALDTILTEKSLVCRRQRVTLTCIADGAALAFMQPAELYAFFGNALDNAIRAACEVADPDRRSITLQVRRVGDLVAIHVENYFAGTRDFADGLPQTTQADHASHGFGTRSMRMVCERYGGTITFSTKGDVFRVNAMLPVSIVPDAPGTE